MKTIQHKINSPVGSLYLIASPTGLCGIFFKKQSSLPLDQLTGEKKSAEKILQKTTKQLDDYFKGTLKKFTIPLEFDGTIFQKKVWNALLKIPYGTTRSYKDIAKLINNPKAVRAVGSANGKNPICIIVPCHRVIAADGKIGGYSGGLSKKIKLLELEKAE